MSVSPDQIIENEHRIHTLEILLKKLVNFGSVDQDDYDEAQKQAAKALSQKYEEVELNE